MVEKRVGIGADIWQTKIRSAERRIFLSTLYIGKSEKELVRPLGILNAREFLTLDPDCYPPNGATSQAAAEAERAHGCPARDARSPGPVFGLFASSVD